MRECCCFRSFVSSQREKAEGAPRSVRLTSSRFARFLSTYTYTLGASRRPSVPPCFNLRSTFRTPLSYSLRPARASLDSW